MTLAPDPSKRRPPASERSVNRPETLTFPGIRALACALLAAAQIASAQDAMPLSEERPPDPEDQVMTYYDAIERVEALGGAYASELVDLYHGLGQSLLDLEDFEEARDAFHRTVLVVRVNSGPNSPEQTNYLYSIADIESRLGNQESAIDVLENIYRVHALEYGEDNPALMPAVMQIFSWYSERYPLTDEAVRPSDFENLSYLAAHIARLSEAENGLGSIKTALNYRALGQLHFLAIHHYVENQTYPEPTLVIDADRIGAEALRERPLVHHFEEGQAAFERAVEAWDAMPEATELERAEARAQLGDWFLALKEFRKAEDEYERAYRQLASNPELKPLADAYMGQPTEVRFQNVTGPFVRELSASETGDELEVSMTVTRTGRLSNIQIVSAPPHASEERLQAVVDYLHNTRFRPAVVDGTVQTSEGSRWVTTLPESVSDASAESSSGESDSEALVAGNDSQS